MLLKVWQHMSLAQQSLSLKAFTSMHWCFNTKCCLKDKNTPKGVLLSDIFMGWSNQHEHRSRSHREVIVKKGPHMSI